MSTVDRSIRVTLGRERNNGGGGPAKSAGALSSGPPSFKFTHYGPETIATAN